MKSIKFSLDNPGDNSIHHKYETRIEGDWIVFTCPNCPGHERRLNWQTGEKTAKGVDARSNIRHSGFHFPIPEEMN